MRLGVGAHYQTKYRPGIRVRRFKALRQIRIPDRSSVSNLPIGPSGGSRSARYVRIQKCELQSYCGLSLILHSRTERLRPSHAAACFSKRGKIRGGGRSRYRSELYLLETAFSGSITMIRCQRKSRRTHTECACRGDDQPWLPYSQRGRMRTQMRGVPEIRRIRRIIIIGINIRPY